MDYKNEILSITEYIRGHVYDELSWEMLAARLYISKYHFHHLFTEIVGMPAARYIREQKLHHALYLLLTTDKNITDIAYTLGFSSHDAFTRVFRQTYHETPSGIRRLFAARRWLKMFFHLNGRKDGSIMNETLADYRFPLYAPFTAGDKRDCLKTVELLLRMTETSRQYGLLALQSFIEEADTLFLKKGIQMICDGLHPDMIKKILNNYIFSSSYKGIELLKRVLIVEGLLLIQDGVNSVIVREVLLSLLGEDFYEEACMHQGYNTIKTIDNMVLPYFEDMETEIYPAGTNLLEAFLLNASDHTIQLVLRETSMEDFLPSFYGSSKLMQKKLCDNLGTSLAIASVEYCRRKNAPDTGIIIKAQHAVLGHYHKLAAEGSIEL